MSRVGCVTTLNRTLLQRQWLVERRRKATIQGVRHLVGMQAQEPNWPYVGLWSRLLDFSRGDLTDLLESRRVVRTTVMRGTQHLVAAQDLRWLRPTVQPVLDRSSHTPFYTAQVDGLDRAELERVVRELVGDATIPRKELAALLEERYPGREGRILASVVELRDTPMIVPAPHSAWGTWGTRAGQAVAFGQPVDGPRIKMMVMRYLAAFGPATVMDVQAWSGLTRLSEVIPSLPLRDLRDDQGRVLYDLDLPDFALAPADLPVPVRFLPAFDNLLLAHADRTRVISDEDRRRVIPGSGVVRPTFLVDGFVHGIWALKGKDLVVTPFRPLPDEAAVHEEAVRLAAFCSRDHVVIALPG